MGSISAVTKTIFLWGVHRHPPALQSFMHKEQVLTDIPLMGTDHTHT